MTHTLPTGTRRLARGLTLCCYLCVAALAATAAWLCIEPTAFLTAAAQGRAAPPITWDFGPAARTLGVLAGWFVLGATGWIMLEIAALTRCYGQGDAITPGAARTIRRIGAGLCLLALLGVVSSSALSLIVTLDAPVGQRTLSIGINARDVALAIAGGVMLLIGTAMVQAVDLRRENEEFV